MVASTQAFVSAAKGSKTTRQLEPGHFRLHKQMNAEAAWNLLVSQTTRIQTTVTIPEGLRLSQIVATLGSSTAFPASAYAAAAKNVAALGLPSYANGKLEGYLFPATYEIQPGMSPADVLQTMVKRFNQESGSISLRGRGQGGQVPVAHVIIIASLIQAEGGRPSDFPKIAEVIYNRLNHNMKLELDSTVEYALGKYGIIATNDRARQLAVQHLPARRAAARPDRQPRRRGHQGGAAPGARRPAVLRHRGPEEPHHQVHRQRRRVHRAPPGARAQPRARADPARPYR